MARSCLGHPGSCAVDECDARLRDLIKRLEDNECQMKTKVRRLEVELKVAFWVALIVFWLALAAALTPAKSALDDVGLWYSVEEVR